MKGYCLRENRKVKHKFTGKFEVFTAMKIQDVIWVVTPGGDAVR
jgi:hypothetical protein